MKTKPVSDVLRGVLNMTLSFFKSQVLKRVKGNVKAERGVEVAFIPITNTITVLNDNDAANKEQVAKVTLDWVNGPLTDYLDEIFTEIILKHDDENVEKILLFAKNLVLGVLRVYSDDDLQNNVQLKALMSATLEDPATEQVLLQNAIRPILEKKIKDTDAVDSIIRILDSAFDNIVKK